MEKLKLILSILRTKSYVILTDDRAVASIPVVDIDTFDNVLLLSGQTAALQEFQARLYDLIIEHEEAIDLLARRSKSKLFAKKKLKYEPTPKRGKKK